MTLWRAGLLADRQMLGHHSSRSTRRSMPAALLQSSAPIKQTVVSVTIVLCLLVVSCANGDADSSTLLCTGKTAAGASNQQAACISAHAVTDQHRVSPADQHTDPAATSAAADNDAEVHPPAVGVETNKSLSEQDDEAGNDSGDSRSKQHKFKVQEDLIQSMAAHMLPRKRLEDKGGYVEFLLFVSSVGKLPALNDPHFNPLVVPVLAPSPGQEVQDAWQLGPAGDMMALLAQHRAQFLVSIGNRSHFEFLQLLPAQVRQKTFHVDSPDQLTAAAIEVFYWQALRVPLGGSPTQPLLSLFTPAYKSGKKIHIPYKSLLAQSYQNWEWVIYDDSPPEHTETWEELSKLRDKDFRVKAFKTDRNDAFIGSVKAQACHMATGQLLIELDHDDELTTDALELMKDALVANPDAGLFYGEAVELYERTNKSVDYGADWAYGQGAHYRTLLNGVWVTAAIAPPLNDKTLRHIVGVPNHVRAWRREAYLAIGGHARSLPVADDYDLVLRTLFKYPAVYIRHLTYVQYRQLDQSTFTFKRNALIQRLTNIVSRYSDQRIHNLLADKGLTDGGRAGLPNYRLLWNDATATGAPLSRSYHEPTARSTHNRPYFTVVIPTYNNTDGLHKAVQSVYAQDFKNWELLIVGDHCPLLDDFMEANKAAIQEGKQVVRYYNMHKHGGPGLHAPLNLAAKVLAPSDWVAYLRDDAVWAPDHLSSLASKIAEDPSRAYVFGSLQLNGMVVLAAEPRQYQLDMSAVAHHRRLIEKYGGWRSQAAVGVANDWDLFSRWADVPWGATLRPTVRYNTGKPDNFVDDTLSVE